MIPLLFLSKYLIISHCKPNLTMQEHPRRYTFLSIPVLSAANKYKFLLLPSLRIGKSGLIHLSSMELNIDSVELSS